MSEPSSPDIVAELDFWLGNDPEPGMFLLMQRARDEIAALRKVLEITAKAADRARAEALEEAAHALEPIGFIAAAQIIRALKEKP